MTNRADEAQNGTTMITQYPWHTMADAPYDGTLFVHLSITTYCGGSPRPTDDHPNLGLYRRDSIGEEGRARLRRDDRTQGFWSSPWGSSTGDDNLTYGHWMTPAEFDACVVESPFWSTMPSDRPVVVFRRWGEFFDANCAWRTPTGISCVGHGGDVSPLWLNGQGGNPHGVPLRWAEVADFIPPRPQWPAPWDRNYSRIMGGAIGRGVRALASLGV